MFVGQVGGVMGEFGLMTSGFIIPGYSSAFIACLNIGFGISSVWRVPAVTPTARSSFLKDAGCVLPSRAVGCFVEHTGT